LTRTFKTESVKAVILDFDGTVYFQRPIQFYNLIRIGIILVAKPHKYREIQIIRRYRKMREHYSESNMPILEVEKDLAQALNQSQEEIRLIREYWLIQSQSSAIKLFQRKALLKRVAQLQNQGALLILWSDYPTAEKSKELELLPDLVFCSEDSRIKMAKPSSAGIDLIVKTLRIDLSEIVMIGDRDDRDGVAASRAGIQYFKVGRRANQMLDRILREKQKKKN